MVTPPPPTPLTIRTFTLLCTFEHSTLVILSPHFKLQTADFSHPIPSIPYPLTAYGATSVLDVLFLVVKLSGRIIAIPLIVLARRTRKIAINQNYSVDQVPAQEKEKIPSTSWQ